ncbi:MalM family protein [Marinobacter zhejiangensis]|uniref:Maltose operon substrate-binding protein (MalM) n=1 Tax=Marinobacter zhejiangensis TaxID=488535 RepID=A0A1I4RF53_9GAMM|nr:MalM family protein [Marinobacter zhejiangensis]SFM50857.1 Maltose operon substrate-binding protein precursor (MalM) [Marinobacter zhejiangensis]
MTFRFNSRWLIAVSLATLVAGCQSHRGAPAPGDSGERYFTWVDEQGRVRQSPISNETGASEPADSIEEVVGQVRREQQGTALAAEADKAAGPTSVSPSPPERPAESASAPNVAAPEYNLSNYPDGDELAEAGFIREGDRLPYFTWRDAEGNIRVSYFRPEARDFGGGSPIEVALKLTPASVYLASDRAPELPVTTDGQLPEAFAVLGIDAPEQSYYERWRSWCCDSLALQQIEPWQLGREFRVLVEESSPSWSLMEGRSHYRLVRLPSQEDLPSFVLRLKSFNRDGLFVPSLAFLDDSLQPLRIVTDLVPEYLPENWHRLGFLDIRVPVVPQQGERWLLIYTRDSDLAGQTVIETERGPKAIPHTPTGMMSLSVSPS